MLCIVSVVDSVAPTSMPINEFVLYRHAHNPNIRQILIVIDPEPCDAVSLPPDLPVHFVGYRLGKIRSLIKNIVSDCQNNNDELVFHLHEIKSSSLFFAAALFTGIRRQSLFTVHSTFAKRNLKYKLASALCVLNAKLAACVSRSAFEGYNPLLKAFKGKNMVALPNGVDTERIDRVLAGLPKEDAAPPKDRRKALICVARLVPLKNHVFLIRLLKRLPEEYTLTLVGNGNAEESLRAYAEECGVSGRVRFLGMLSRNEVFRTLSNSDIYLSASTIEGLPISVLEAMCAGLLPILSDIPPHAEIASGCQNVSLLPPDEEQWVDKITEYAALSDAEFAEKSAAVAASVKNAYSLEKMHAAYDKLYQKLLSESCK